MTSRPIYGGRARTLMASCSRSARDSLRLIASGLSSWRSWAATRHGSGSITWGWTSPRNSGIPELVAHGESGLLAEEADEAGLADLIAELVADPARWSVMGRLGRAKIAQDFDRRALGRELRALYEEVAREAAL